MNKHSLNRPALGLLVLALVVPTLAQEGGLEKVQPQGITPQEIIQKFAAKEQEFKRAREGYTYTQDVRVQTLAGDTADGEYRLVTDIVFDNQGKRLEQVKFAPQSSLRGVSLSMEDYEDMRRLAAFTLPTEDLPQYDILYVGRQKQDELNCYVFDVAPKNVQKQQRYFQGRIWVDDHDLQIVMTRGKSVGYVKPQKKKRNEDEQLFPTFTTYREQIDGVYWFPTYSRADETLHFTGNDVHIREVIKYTDYKRFGANVKVTYEGQELPKSDKAKDPQGKTQATPPPQP